MTVKNYQLAPDVVNIFYIEDEKGWVSVIDPEDGTNFITNPSFEKGISGWSFLNCDFVQSLTYQCKGLYSLKVTPWDTNVAGVYFTASLLSTPPYVYSIYLKGYPGDRYQIFGAAGGLTRSIYSQLTEVVASGNWQRISAVCGDPIGKNLVIVRKQGGSTNPFYVDCAQAEESNYVTTYIDGDQTCPGTTDKVYFWNGSIGASISYRNACGNGGREVNLLNLGFKLIAVIGLGMMPLVNVSLPIASGGAMYQRSIFQPREFTLAGSLTADNLPELQRQRSDLISLLNPFKLAQHQPRLMNFHIYDDADNEENVGELMVQYQSGLEGTIDNPHQDRIGLVFTQYIPAITNAASQLTPYPRQPLFEIYEKPGGSGEYNVMRLSRRTGKFEIVNPGLPIDINALTYAVGPNNELYAGGTDPLYLLSYDGSSIGNVNANIDDDVNKLLYLNGNLYTGGKFTSIDAGTTPNTLGIAYYDITGAVWHAMGTGADDGAVVDMVYDSFQNRLYVIGTFTGMGGVANTNGIAYWDFATSAWVSAYGEIDNNTAYDIDINYSGDIFVAGSFTSVGGVAANYIAKLSNGVWTALPAGPLYSSPDLFQIAITPDNNLYFYYDNTAAPYFGGHIMRFNGSSWILVTSTFETSGMVADLYENKVYLKNVSPTAYQAPLVILQSDVFYSAGVEESHPGEINIPVTMDPNSGDLYIAQTQANYLGDHGLNSYQNFVSTSLSVTYPTLSIVGPTTLYGIRNYFIGQAINFDALIVLKGEVIIINASPSEFSVKSSIRGDIRGNVQSGSSFIFELHPGNNTVGFFANSHAVLSEGTYANYGSGVLLTGIIPSNSDNGRLYSKLVEGPAGSYHIDFYKDNGYAAGDLVAHSETFLDDTPAVVVISEDNTSNVSGAARVNVPSGTGDISDILVDSPMFFIGVANSYASIDQMR